MTTQSTQYLNNPTMLTKVADIEEFDTRTKTCLKNDNIVFFAQLLAHTEEYLLNVPGLGRNSIEGIKTYLYCISSDSQTYTLGTVGTNCCELSTLEQIREYFEIEEENTQKPLQGFCADDFKIGNICVSENGDLDVGIETPETFSNLMDDGYFVLKDDTPDIVKHTLADQILPNLRGITLIYTKNNGGLERAARVDILKGFADAINVITPRAQQRYLESLSGQRELYGIAPK